MDYRPRARRATASKLFVLQLEKRICALEARISELEGTPTDKKDDELTREDIMKMLDEKGVKYIKRSSKADLLKLLEE